MPDRYRWQTPAEIRQLVDTNLKDARTATDPWPALETAHLLSQPWWWPHPGPRRHAARRDQNPRPSDQARGSGSCKCAAKSSTSRCSRPIQHGFVAAPPCGSLCGRMGKSLQPGSGSLDVFKPR
jgi:hypothetical protein